MHFLKRVNYCVKSVAVDCKSFWLYFWSLHFVKRFQLGIWEHNPLGVMRQFLGSDYKQKLLQGRGIDCLDALLSNIDCLSTLSKRDAQFGQQVEKDILNLRSTTTLSLQNNNSSLKNQLLTISFKGEFS